jgi:predicted enzyme related to lactoylglutathione lyase
MPALSSYHAPVTTTRFSRFVLRTTAVDVAAAFYEDVLGHSGDGIVALSETALARGAQPHWLGQIGVRDVGGVESIVSRFLERGATRLGPPSGIADFAVLRDPGGAVVAVTDAPGPSSSGVVWHQLNTKEPARAVANYSALFGWSVPKEIDLGAFGHHQQLAFGPGEPVAGLISDVAGRPEVHTHWLFFFGVPSLDRALQRVRAHDGFVMGPRTLESGVRIAACDDPQGAGFGLIEFDDVARLASS